MSKSAQAIFVRKWMADEVADTKNINFEFCKSLPRELQRLAWLWEIERELQSGLGPFCDSVLRINPDQMALKSQAAQLLPICDVAAFQTVAEKLRYIPDARSALFSTPQTTGSRTRIEFLVVDWSRSITEIVADFKKEVEQRLSKQPRPTTGNTEAFSAWLNDLSIYRQRKAGCKIPLPKRLAKASTAKDWGSNIAHAVARTERKIRERFATLKLCDEEEFGELPPRMRLLNFSRLRKQFVSVAVFNGLTHS